MAPRKDGRPARSAPYEPLRFDRQRNAPSTLLDDEPPLGEQQLRGIPFQIGRGQRAFLAPTTATTIRVGCLARTVVFAHRLLDSQIMSGGPVGSGVADYIFRLADGMRIAVSIRERFEIATLVEWGQLPFNAVPDQPDQLQPRWRGEWAEAGMRWSESSQGWPSAYWLWCWTNPQPEIRLDAIEIVPRGPRFLIAGITIGAVAENPLTHRGVVPVRVELRNAGSAARPIQDLAVAVDRGVAGYAWPLPTDAAPLVGWGEPANAAASPTYVEVAAADSATLAVTLGGKRVGQVRWGELLAAGRIERARMRLEVLETARNWVETVVVDDATGQPVPCRVHFRSPAGVPYQPHGHPGHVNSDLQTWNTNVGGDVRLGQTSYAYIDGTCQGWLPRGEVIVEAARGFEYEPLREQVTIAPGQRRLELRLKRMADLRAHGWYSGDTHVHFLSTVAAQHEACCEDLNVVNLLGAQWGALFTGTAEFTGEPLVSHDGQTIVWAAQENRQHLLGHLSLLGIRRPIYPWSSDGPSEAELGGTLDTTLAHWADAARAQGATVILPHLPHPNGETAALVATGRGDAVEMILFSPFNHLEYYRYLNAGYRLPLVGGTDKMSSEIALGQIRTYVRIPPEEGFSYASWSRNLTLGRTFLSGGPLLELTVEGADIGDTVQLPAGGGSVEVVARAQSTIPVQTLQLVHNGAVVAETSEQLPSRELTLRTTLPVTAHGWICARVAGPGYEKIETFDRWQVGSFAHTSPIYIAVGGDWTMADRDVLQYMQTLVDGSLEYIRGLAPRRPQAATLYHHGEPDHQAFLERPFLEAQQALHRRLHALGLPH